MSKCFMLTKEKQSVNSDRTQVMHRFSLHNYYTMPQIAPQRGKCEVLIISSAENFLCQHLQADIHYLSQQGDQAIQTRLWTSCYAPQDAVRAQAALSFRCFVVNAAKNSIDSLVNKFGLQLGQTRQTALRQDLYPCVLDDNGRLVKVLQAQKDQRLVFDFSDRQSVPQNRGLKAQPRIHTAFSIKVLSTFDPNRMQGENLKNWTYRLVKQNREVKSVLHEYGIHFCQPWQFLSRIRPQQLRQIETQFSNLPHTTIDEHVKILTTLRLVHQEHQLRTRKGKATETNRKSIPDKLEQLRTRLETENICLTSIPELDAKLKEMMLVLLHYQAQISHPKSIHTPIEEGSKPTDLEQLIVSTSPTGFEALAQQAVKEFYARVHEHFQPLYQQKRVALLDESIQIAIQQRRDFLAKQSGDRAKQYMRALHYFFCQGLSMQEIAHQVHLDYQYQVSRLLKLSSHSSSQSQTSPDLISSCLLQMAQLLRDQFFAWTQTSTTAEQRQLLASEPSLLWQLLDAPIQDITQIFHQARAEISHPHHARTTLFAQRLSTLVEQYTQNTVPA